MITDRDDKTDRGAREAKVDELKLIASDDVTISIASEEMISKDKQNNNITPMYSQDDDMDIFSDNEEELKKEDTRKFEDDLGIWDRVKRFFTFSS